MTTETKSDYKVVGTRPVRHDGADKVTGKARFGADVSLPGMLFGAVLRSPHAHARILSIDTQRAAAHPAVRAVMTSEDLVPGPTVGTGIVPGHNHSSNVMARGKALYKGHAIAALAATSLHAAQEALDLIDIEYEPLPAVLDVESAMKPDAPVLHEDMEPYSLGPVEGFPPNVVGRELYALGDISDGFAAAEVTIDREFRTHSVHQGYIEPQNGTASWSPDGKLTIWCSSQGHFGIRDQVASILGLPVSDVKVVPMEIGGGFGGKLPIYLEPLAAVLSRKTGQPVKLTMSRTEVLEATGPTSGSHVRIRIGATGEGRFTAGEAVVAFETGAFPPSPITAAAAAVFAPYRIDNVRIDAYDVVDNKPKVAPYRAPGAPIVAFAVESVIDELAKDLDIDPIDLRILNAATEGDRRADGVMNGRIGALETMEAVRSHPHYSAPVEGDGVGRGVSLGFCRNNSGPACAVGNVLADGRVSLIEGSMDIGGSRTAVAQMFAEVLSLPVEDVLPTVGDTETIGYTSNTGGSGVAYKSGWAAYEAAHDIRRQVIKRAADIWGVDAGEVEYAGGEVRHVSDTELRMTFKEIAAAANDTGGPIVGRANLNPGGSAGSYSALIVDVRVDRETGKTDILRATAFQDVGTAIHPSYVEGQIQGGIAQGIGWALNEEYWLDDDGVMKNSSLLDYRMPTSLDLPMIETVLVEVPNPNHPYGVKGVGEASISAPLAAVANAIKNATGTRLRELPMTPQAIVAAAGD